MKKLYKIICMMILFGFGTPLWADENDFAEGLRFYLNGETDKSLQIWKSLAEQGDVRSQRQLAYVYFTRTDLKDYEKSLYWYQQAIAQGDREAEDSIRYVEDEYKAWKAVANEYGRQAASETIHLRANLHEGVMTNCGLVVEVKSKIVYIQTQDQPRWFLKDEIYAPGSRQCQA